LYPWDLVVFQLWLLLDTGLSRTLESVFQTFIAPEQSRKLTVPFPTASIVEFVIIALLSVRLSFRYTIVIVALPLIL
jgi:hypothetical protein